MKKPLARPAAWIQAAGRRGLHANQGISSIDALWDAFAPSMAAAPRDARRAIQELRRLREKAFICFFGVSRNHARVDPLHPAWLAIHAMTDVA